MLRVQLTMTIEIDPDDFEANYGVTDRAEIIDMTEEDAKGELQASFERRGLVNTTVTKTSTKVMR